MAQAQQAQQTQQFDPEVEILRFWEEREDWLREGTPRNDHRSHFTDWHFAQGYTPNQKIAVFRTFRANI